jgi:hypothetical protein
VLRLGKLAVAAQQDLLKTATETDRQGAIDLRGGSLLRRPIAGAVHHAQDFAGVGQGQYQGVIAPGAVVGDVHAPFALAGGRHQKAVHVQDGLPEEGGGLVGPYAQAGVVENVEQRVNVVLGKPPTEIAGGGGIGDAACPQGVEEHLIVAEQFQVFQTGAATQGQVGQGEDMIRFMVRQVDLEQLQAAVEGIDQADLPNQFVHGADATDGDAAAALGDFIVDVAGRHDRLGTAAQVGPVQTALDSAFAVGQFFGYAGFHSKSFPVLV